MNTVTEAPLLIELGCEELPAGQQSTLIDQLANGLASGLRAAKVLDEDTPINTWVTPRRLAVRFAKVSASQAAQTLHKKGPALSAAFDAQGQATPAALGFARSVGLAVEDLDRVEIEGGAYLQATIQQPGQTLHTLLQAQLAAVVADMAGAKSMRWSAAAERFLRPVRWLLALHGEAVLPIQLFGLTADRFTYGHRLHAPGPHALKHAEDYVDTLVAAKVQADPLQRRAHIVAASTDLAEAAALHVTLDSNLLDEVVGLVEWPVPVMGAFEPTFLDVPPEALISSMQQHQKSFPLRHADGQLAPHFIAVANLISADLAAMRAGFERVITPRLADARFFYEQDRRQPLSAWVSRLDQITFQQDLGSLGDKVRRLASLAAEFAHCLGADAQAAARAASLCKADLLSQMVGEFPELQGVMGRYYALADGEVAAVADAIAEHYLPRQAGDVLPAASVSQALALADRLDSLVGIFAVGQKPRSGKDPFALRRAALAVVRLLDHSGSTRPLSEWVGATAQTLRAAGLVVEAAIEDEVVAFVIERLRSFAADSGLDSLTVQAIDIRSDVVVADFMARAKAVQGFADDPLAEPLIAANKRIANLLKAQQDDLPEAVQPARFEDSAEQSLFDALQRAEAEVSAALSSGHYTAALTTLAGLRTPVDAFFESVMVMAEAEAVRHNRLALLTRLRALFLQVADVARLGRA